jgi:preprotein translocase subunit SecF
LIHFPSNLLVLISGIALIYVYIRYSIPSFAIILCAFADIFFTLVVTNLIGIELSGAGIIAFLMLIGYSVDTDILMTTRLLRTKGGSVNHRLWGAFKTGITMTLTALTAVTISLILVRGLSETLEQIFIILIIGLVFDIFNTWVTNSSMLKWYMEVKKIQ